MKRIVVCADGTWNRRDQVVDASGLRKPSNVTKMARAVRPIAAGGVHQVVCYHDGLGTGGPLDRLTGGAFGRGIEENIAALYRFILYNYVPGDELYFFGFSRGAFTVRSLAGFMKFIGLIQKDDDYYMPEFYACYAKDRGPGSAEWKHLFEDTDAKHPRPRVEGRRACPPIRFIGVWDTVGSLGAPGLLGRLFNKGKYRYHDVGLNEYTQNAVHALALDEQRQPFLPTLWERPRDWPGQRLMQAWFAGVHANIGGGCKPDGLANEALHWVAEQAEDLGLELDRDYLAKYEPHFDSKLQDSMSALYRLARLGPVVRPVGAFAAHGEMVHRSALDRMGSAECAYRPPNLAGFAPGAAPPLPVAQTRRQPLKKAA